MNVELQAVTKVIQMVSKCPHLEPYIDSNDKTPLTDGHIDVHSSTAHTKTTFEGRVSVQVKGRQLSGRMQLPRTFPITKTDLLGYLKNQGVLYFVIFINPKTHELLPAYALLSPFKIQRIINEMANQKQIGVRIKPLPSDPSRIEDIVKLALKPADEKPSMGIDLGKLKDLSRITLYTDGSLNLDAPITLTRADFDFSLEFETAGGMVLSVDEELVITPPEYVGEVTDLIVTCGDFEFRNPIRRRVDKDTVELELSEGLKIQSSGTGQTRTGSISLSMRKTLNERFGDLGFYLACTEEKAFSINGEENRIEVGTVNDVQNLWEHFEYLKTLMSLCDHMGAETSLIDLEPLEGKRGRQLIGLHEVMIGGKEISDTHHETGRILQPLGDWSFQLLVVQESANGTWLCRDLFDPELGQQFVMSGEDETGEPFIRRVTPYEIVAPDHLPFTLNLHLDNLVNSYESIVEYPGSSDYANATVINLIGAADTATLRKAEFLNAAACLNNWLISKEGKLPYHQINHWQIAARNDQITRNDRFAIRSLKAQASRLEIEQSHFVETACAILLGDEEEIAFCLARLDKTQLAKLKEWPIWRLHDPAEAPEDEPKELL